MHKEKDEIAENADSCPVCTGRDGHGMSQQIPRAPPRPEASPAHGAGPQLSHPPCIPLPRQKLQELWNKSELTSGVSGSGTDQVRKGFSGRRMCKGKSSGVAAGRPGPSRTPGWTHHPPSSICHAQTPSLISNELLRAFCFPYRIVLLFKISSSSRPDRDTETKLIFFLLTTWRGRALAPGRL